MIKFKVWEYPNNWHNGLLRDFDSIVNNTMQYLNDKSFGDRRKVLQFTGCYDSQGNELYEDDVIEWRGREFRIYRVAGGFAVKTSAWNKSLDDLNLPPDRDWET